VAVLSGNMQSLAPRLAKLNELIGDVPGLMAPTPPKLLAPVLLPGQQGSGVPGMPDPAAVAAAAFIPGKIGNAFQPGAMLAPTGMLSPGKLGGMFFPGARPAPVAATPGGFGAQPAPVAATPSGFGAASGRRRASTRSSTSTTPPSRGHRPSTASRRTC
jgi:hypothetical protein